jgi:hypothetical protein
VKPRDRTPQVLLEVPPVALRMFDDPSWGHDRADLGRVVYGSREAWLAGRAQWARDHGGLTITGWWHELLEQASVRARTLAEFNEPFSPQYLIEDDELDSDPRLEGAVR